MKAATQVVLYDGVCRFCDATVGFALPRDREARLKFSPLQSRYARVLLQQAGVELRPPYDTVFYWDGRRLHNRSSAILRIFAELGGPWKLCAIGLVVPKFIRDAAYQFVARRRYAWFGKDDRCILPPPAWRERFIDLESVDESGKLG